MRKVIEPQLEIGWKPLEEITLPLHNRDDFYLCMTAILHLYHDVLLRARLFSRLAEIFPAGVRTDRGRPGMFAWRIFVLGVLKQVLRCDYQRLAMLATEVQVLRQILFHSEFDDTVYCPQTLQDNLSLLTSEILAEFIQMVAECGQKVAGKQEGEVLQGRCDSKVCKTNVEFPSDLRLLRDSVCGGLRECAKTADALDVPGWQQIQHLMKTVEKAHKPVCIARKYKSRPGKVRYFLRLCRKRGRKVVDFLRNLYDRKTELERKQATGSLTKAEEKMLHTVLRAMQRIYSFLGYMAVLHDQVRRRVLHGEKIPHREKIFSITKPFTRWIVKGKEGVLCELGVPVAIIEDQYPFILGHEILWTGTDKDVAFSLTGSVQEQFPSLRECSYDRGFYSPEVREKLDEMLDVNAMPKKGRMTKEEQERQSDPAFQRARKRHPGVESALNNLDHRGWNLVRETSREGFARVVATAILAANVHRLGRLLREQEIIKKAKRRRKLAA